VESLAKLLGHNQLTTTQRYIDGADPTLREDFLQAIVRIQAVSIPESSPLPSAQAFTIVPVSKNAEERPKTNELLDKMKHLAEDLPDWLREPIMEHTRRRAARWPDHRLKAQLFMHFSSLCRTGRWLVQNRRWQQLDRLQREICWPLSMPDRKMVGNHAALRPN
jgi:hypothetical protein